MTREERIKMRKIRVRRRLVANVIVAVVVGGGCFIAGRLTAPRSEIVKNLTTPEVAPSECEHLFDGSIIESQWCAGDEGHVRMMGGWMYQEGQVQGETEEVWQTDLPLDVADFYLLWVHDAGTPTVEDDELIKLWREVY